MTDLARIAKACIGIPVYNGESHIGEAIASALSQSFADLELVIWDNGSSDRTEDVCREYVTKDRRVRYFRSATNEGPVLNFQRCFDSCQADFFMWLASDDSIDRDYLQTCISVLENDLATVLVSGKTIYFDEQGVTVPGNSVSIEQSSPRQRVVAYARTVGDNGVFYGVYRRSATSGGRLYGLLGGDWLWLCEIALLGKIVVCQNVAAYRRDSWRMTNARQYYKRIARALEQPGIVAVFPRLSTAIGIAWHMAFISSVFRRLPVVSRLLLSAEVAIVLWLRLTSTLLKSAVLRVRR